MRKEVVSRFIEKYRLGGNVNSVKLTSKDDTLHTRFITDDKSLLGELKMNSWTFENINFGVYDTEQLSKLLNVLTDDVKCTHGATSGDISEEAIFYIMSRGFDRPTALNILIRAFGDEIIDIVKKDYSDNDKIRIVKRNEKFYIVHVTFIYNFFY